MTTPDINNLTLPGKGIFYFDNGTGERDLGHFEMKNVDIEPRTEDLKYYSTRSGKRRLARTWNITEELLIRFRLNEPIVENLQAFFKGGAIETVGAGSAAVTNQTLALTGTILHSVGQYYGLSSVTVRQFLNKVYRYDGAAYVDNSVEADTEAGTPFSALTDTDEFLYLGKNTQFKEIYLDLAVNGSYTGILWEYWDGDSWATLTTGGAGDGLDADGAVTFTLPGDWAKTTVNGQNLYWIRVSATVVTTPATVNHIRQNLTQNTDWVLDPGQAGAEGRLPGRVGRLAAGKIVDGEEIKVSYTYITWTALRFPIAESDFIEGAARFELRSSGDGIDMDIELPKCQLKPNGNITLDDTKQMEVPMLLEVLDNYDVTPTYPFGRVMVYAD